MLIITVGNDRDIRQPGRCFPVFNGSDNGFLFFCRQFVVIYDDRRDVHLHAAHGVQCLGRVVPAGAAADAQHSLLAFCYGKNRCRKIGQPRFFPCNDLFTQRFVIQEPGDFPQPCAGVLPAHRIHVPDRRGAKCRGPFGGCLFQPALGLPGIVQGNQQRCGGQVFPLGKGNVTGKLPLHFQPEMGEKPPYFPGVLAAGTHLVAQQQNASGNSGLRFDEALHDQSGCLKIAVRIFAAQKPAVGNAEDGNLIRRFRVVRFLLHIVADDTGHAGGGDDQALGAPRFHHISDTAPQPFRAAEDAVLFLQVGGNQGNGIHIFVPVVADDAVLCAQVHQRSNVGAAGRAVEDHRAARTEADGAPDAGHGAAAGTVFGKKPLCR